MKEYSAKTNKNGKQIQVTPIENLPKCALYGIPTLSMNTPEAAGAAVEIVVAPSFKSHEIC